jgi:hypothetical protein
MSTSAKLSRRYSPAELSTPEAYAADAALATLARRVAEAATHIDATTGDRKRLALAGGMADAVHAAVTQACDAQDAAASKTAAARAALAELSLPSGWSIELGSTEAVLRGPRDETLHASLRRHGTWDAVERVWRLPVSAGLTFARSLQRAAGPSAVAKREMQSQAKRRAELERWVGFVEAAAKEGRVYERGVSECRSRMIADHADLQARLDAAIDTVRAAKQRAEQERAKAMSQRAVASASAPSAPARRVLFPLGAAPAIGLACRLRDQVVVYTEAGRSFRISDEHPSTCGSHLLGHEGEPGAYYYYRPATEVEVAQLVASETAAAQQRESIQRRAADVRTVVAAIRRPTNFAPAGSSVPAGQIVDGSLSAGHSIVIAEAEVWYIEAHGDDGDDWSANNVPRAMAWRTADAEIVQRARALADQSVTQEA